MTTQIVRLERFGYDVFATWGRIFVPGCLSPYFTVERPWAYNARSVSCIPTGMYHLKRHDSEAHPCSWVIVGLGVSRYEFANEPRFGCLIHAANFAHEVEGCIGVGDSITSLNGGVGVSRSKATLKRLDEALGRLTNPKLEITSGR